MKLSLCIPLGLLLVVGAAPGVSSQEAHPLTGSWVGYWGPSPDHRNRIRVAMDWDGQRITGIVNPGTDDLPFTEARLDPSDWSVHIRIEAEDPAGNPITYVIDGRIEDLGSPTRSVVGTWRHGDTAGDFRITLQ